MYLLSGFLQSKHALGRDITKYLQLLLRKSGYVFHTTAEAEVVREIKEETCYVAFNPSKEEKLEADSSHATGHSYRLPDGQLVELGAERFRAPEILFKPSLIGAEYPGIHQCVVDSIFKSDLDIRKTLLSQIVIAGGTTMLPGFGDRLLNEVRKSTQKATVSGVKIRISAPPNRNVLTWIGGSILASLAAFKSMWITKSMYEEQGANIIHKRTL